MVFVFFSMEERKTIRKGFRTVFLLALCGGILAEAILFLGRQLKEVNSFLQEDFRIIAIADRKLSKTGSQSRIRRLIKNGQSRAVTGPSPAPPSTAIPVGEHTMLPPKAEGGQAGSSCL